jgi:hypothetical protein
MRKVGPREFQQEMRARGLSARFGDYGDGDPNVLSNRVYSEREIFRGESGNPGVALDAVAAPITVVRNRVFFNLIPFSYGSGNGSQVLLPSNEMRRFLTVQNQSTGSFMYVNFSSEAAANVGIELYPAQAVIYDLVVPYNSITIFVNDATPRLGVVVEGALQL